MSTIRYLALLTLLLLANPVLAGTISGTVRAEGKTPAEDDAAGGKYASRKFKFAERMNYAEMRDFVVHIEGPPGSTNATPALTAKVTTRRIAQKSAVFSPHVLPVMVGTTVEWPNEDEIFHNVFSVSEAKPFDLGLYKHPEVKRVTFDKPGRVDIFCSIHSSMNCIILILENPWFASTDAAGAFVIKDVPAGDYKLRAWHERLPPQTKEVTVTESGQIKVDFVLGIRNLPQY